MWHLQAFGVLGVLFVLSCGITQADKGDNYLDWLFKNKPYSKKPPIKEKVQIKDIIKDFDFDNAGFAHDIADGVWDEEEIERRLHPVRPRKLPSNIFCKREQKEGLQTFCYHLKEGDYYDPWNPFCGFIRCRNVTPPNRKTRMVATRELCREGTWVSDQDKKMRFGRDSICRVALAINVTDGDICMGGSINKKNRMCAPAKRVLQMNDKTKLY